MKFPIFKLVLAVLVVCLLIGFWFLYTEIYTASAQKTESVKFEVRQGENAGELAERLADEGVVRSAWLFKKYLVLTGADKKINVGEFEVVAPITLARVADVLSEPGLNERVITILPGWDLRDIAKYFEKEGIVSSTEFYKIAGKPAEKYKISKEKRAELNLNEMTQFMLGEKPDYVGYEGYLAPETYRVYKNAGLGEIIKKLLEQRAVFFNSYISSKTPVTRSFYDILTMASILEREVKSIEDKKLVADIFWRRVEKNWALQADSTVHYAVGKDGEVFTTAEDRASMSSWNTYRYPGLPPGPISNPSLESIQAALEPEKNDYWYFLTTPEGEVKYAKTLEEHNKNRLLFLK